MCRNLSETAARDLEKFVRSFANRRVGKERGEFPLAWEAYDLLDKHGLLTPADVIAPTGDTATGPTRRRRSWMRRKWR